MEQSELPQWVAENEYAQAIRDAATIRAAAVKELVGVVTFFALIWTVVGIVAVFHS